MHYTAPLRSTKFFTLIKKHKALQNYYNKSTEIVKMWRNIFASLIVCLFSYKNNENVQ